MNNSPAQDDAEATRPVRHDHEDDRVLPRITPLPDSGAEDAKRDAEANRHTHIVLLGLMGSGKSTVGILVANELSRPYVDSDLLVELRTGHLPDRFAEVAGLDKLHAVETAIVRDTLAMNDAVVLASAASAIDTLGPQDLADAWTIWLETSPEVLADRVHGDHQRPLLANDPSAVLAEQQADHGPRGRSLADLTVVTDHRTPSEVAAEICRAWRAIAGH